MQRGSPAIGAVPQGRAGGHTFHQEPEDILIQVFDKEFKEWINIDCSFVVEARQKFNIVVDSVQKPAKVKLHKEECRVVSN